MCLLFDIFNVMYVYVAHTMHGMRDFIYVTIQNKNNWNSGFVAYMFDASTQFV